MPEEKGNTFGSSPGQKITLVRHLKIINVKFAIPAVNCFI
jgi:hypothetical protein